MARLTSEQKEEIVAKWKAGRSQNYLAKEYNTSPATINKYCKGVEQENIEIVNSKVSVYTALDGKSEQEVNAIHQIADERTRHLLLFQNSALRNQRKADEMLDEADKLNDVESHSRITQRNKETVLGKDKTVELNNVNAQQNNKLTIEEISTHVSEMLPD